MIFRNKTKRIERNRNIIAQSVLFDEEFYRNEYRIQSHVDAAFHYCSSGWKDGFKPSYFFDTNFYLTVYDDVRLANMNPLVHYVTDGGRELRRPCAEFDPQAFLTAHPEYENDTKTPAEICISIYKTYEWEYKKSLFLTEKHVDRNLYNENHQLAVNNTNIEQKLAAMKADQGSIDYIAAFREFFDEGYYLSQNRDVRDSGMDPYQHFVQHGQYENRDPSPQFDTFFYKQSSSGISQRGFNVINHYISQGMQTNKSIHNSEYIFLQESEQALIGDKRHLRMCVHAHCYYPELIRELIPGFKNLSTDTFLIITVTTEADGIFVKKTLNYYSVQCPSEVRVVPNKGRDIAPFLVGCNDIWVKYDLILHVHTKHSPHVYWGDEWRKYLFDHLFGSVQLVEAIEREFLQNERLGCLYPRNFYRIREFAAREANDDLIRYLIDMAGFGEGSYAQIDYPAGSMAWYRTNALARVLDIVTNLNQFDDERGQIDQTLAHALERVIPSIIRESGFEVRNFTSQIRHNLSPCHDLPLRESSAQQFSDLWGRDTLRIASRPVAPMCPLVHTYNPSCLNIHWIVPSFAQSGAGGHMTIFRIVQFLEMFGHRQTIWLQNPVHFADQAEAKQKIQQWYRPIGDRVHVRFLPDDVREISGDVLIATDCWTAFPASQVTNFKERFYFIQDYEPYFHAVGDLHLLIEETYSFGFANICAGSWLLNMMNNRGLWARSWELCADHDVYYSRGGRYIATGPQLKIAFYARRYTPRRAVALGFAAFDLLHKQGVNFEVHMFGEDNLRLEYDFPHEQHGIMSPTELAELYHSCDIGLVFSTTNYSLIPLEMMACGLPVVEIDTDSTRAIFKDNEVTFARPTPHHVAKSIIELASDVNRIAVQREKGFKFVGKTSWDDSARQIEAAFFERLKDRGYREIIPDRIFSPAIRAKHEVSVVIPTFNAGADLEKVLMAIVEQRCAFRYDVVLVDSESSDETVEIARKFQSRGVYLESIKKADFQHGRTRNFGISISRGDYVAVLTQDACPKDDHWLSQLIAGFTRGPRVAGVIGRHEAYPEHNAFIKRDINDAFAGFSLLPDVYDIDIGLPGYVYPGGTLWRMLMQFYSDNNSAMSREAWKVLPYPEVEWGEDQLWADEALRLGSQKAYANDAVVYHSHNFDPIKQYSVSFTEGEFWGKYFGIDHHVDAENALEILNNRDRSFAIINKIDSVDLKRRFKMNAALISGRKDGYFASINRGY